jgi:hypothetical protein
MTEEEKANGCRSGDSFACRGDGDNHYAAGSYAGANGSATAPNDLHAAVATPDQEEEHPDPGIGYIEVADEVISIVASLAACDV